MKLGVPFRMVNELHVARGPQFILDWFINSQLRLSLRAEYDSFVAMSADKDPTEENKYC